MLSKREVYACELLEAQRLRFGRDFGRDNCEQIAAERWTRSLDLAQMNPKERAAQIYMERAAAAAREAGAEKAVRGHDTRATEGAG